MALGFVGKIKMKIALGLLCEEENLGLRNWREKYFLIYRIFKKKANKIFLIHGKYLRPDIFTTDQIYLDNARNHKYISKEILYTVNVNYKPLRGKVNGAKMLGKD